MIIGFGTPKLKLWSRNQRERTVPMMVHWEELCFQAIKKNLTNIP
jgi:hypothetical protein